MYKHKENGEGIATKGHVFALRMPNGETDKALFASPFRAAEQAMAAYKVDKWTPLKEAGFRIVAIA